MGSYSKWELEERQELLEKVFAGRESLNDDAFYDYWFVEHGISRETAIGVREVLSEVLEADLGRLAATDDFSKELSLFWEFDSLASVEVAVALERKFGIKISDGQATAMRTVWDIVIGIESILHHKTMRIIQLTPGAGGMFCGNCFHDNTLVAALRKLGHDATMLPLYLPLRLDEPDESEGNPIFFGGINVYLQQKSGLFRNAPRWMHRLLNSRKLLDWAAGRAASTRADEVGELLLSMLRGEEGNQNREITELITWLREQAKPEIICLSNALLIGMVRRLKAELQTPVVCLLQGEEPFLDSLPEKLRASVWQLLTDRAADLDGWIAPSRWAGERMTRRLNLKPERVHVVYDGINLDGYNIEIRNPKSEIRNQKAPVLGYFARMCKEKGLDTLVEAYIHIKNGGRVPRLKLHIGGGCGPGDEPFVKTLRARLAEAGYIGEVSFSPNLNRAEKIAFLQALDVFSVPANYGESFGLYVVEALAAGVPVVQPHTAAFPEIIEATRGGLLCEPADAKSLAQNLESLLTNPEQARALGDAGRAAVFEKFSAEAMARTTLAVFEKSVGP